MNTSVTSREDILQAAKDFALAHGAAELNMRTLARQCGISVGSIYNYFPAKTDLMIAVVAEIWMEILRPSLFEQAGGSFLAMVDAISASIQSGITTYPGFFGAHAVVIDDKTQGRSAMEQYFRHMEQSLCQVLASDPAVRPGIWTETFSPAQFSVFVFDFLRQDLLQGQNRSGFLRELLRRSIY